MKAARIASLQEETQKMMECKELELIPVAHER